MGEYGNDGDIQIFYNRTKPDNSASVCNKIKVCDISVLGTFFGEGGDTKISIQFLFREIYNYLMV